MLVFITEHKNTSRIGRNLDIDNVVLDVCTLGISNMKIWMFLDVSSASHKMSEDSNQILEQRLK